MKTVILSPHTDDAIFSLGDYIQSLSEVTILSVFAGVPKDSTGMQKHITLRKEHERACQILGAEYINLEFLDDVYEPRPSIDDISNRLILELPKFDRIIAPIGIHHPDHVLLREVMKGLGRVDRWYMDLPYGTLYPEAKIRLVHDRFQFNNTYKIFEAVTGLKRTAVSCYASQLQSDHILGEIMVTEELYD